MNGNTAQKSILLLAANPKQTKSLRLQEEEREIKDRLRLAGYGKIPINSTGATRPRDIQQAMLDFKPQIVHFSGHGAGQDGLVFEDFAGQEKLVSSEGLANLFRLFSDQVECVVLNACYSKFQAEAIARHIDYVVGMSQALGDKAAIEFAVGFYAALGAERSIEFSYELGCNAIELEGIAEYLTPVLYRKMSPPLGASDQPPIPEHLTPVLYQQGGLLRVELDNSKLQNHEFNPDTARGRSETRSSDGLLSPSLEVTTLPPPTSPVQPTQQQSETQLLSEKNEIILVLINSLFDALCSPNVEVGIQAFEAIAHKSLFSSGQIEPNFRKNNFSPAFATADRYKRPIQIISSKSTGRTRLGSRTDRDDGEEQMYMIARNDESGGLAGHVRIFLPADGSAPKISGISL
ncbi:CHAT domain-containing protein [Nostocales cyanobacterium LEGE 12452]|nr:CHAT domain-containing protein [Nostocales cyanobacterium LEGE 12452]